MRAVALGIATMLVAVSTIMPTLSHAQKYAAHLANYGGYDARASAISGLVALYVDPAAPMLPVVLSAPGELELATVLPSPCSMDKTVLTRVQDHTPPGVDLVGFWQSAMMPEGLNPMALRGPPRSDA